MKEINFKLEKFCSFKMPANATDEQIAIYVNEIVKALKPTIKEHINFCLKKEDV